MEGARRCSACLLTKQLCQLAVGAAWGFAIAPGGWGRVCGGKGGEGKGRPAAAATAAPACLDAGDRGLASGLAGKLSQPCPSNKERAC